MWSLISTTFSERTLLNENEVIQRLKKNQDLNPQHLGNGLFKTNDIISFKHFVHFVKISNIDDLSRVVISYKIYETSLQQIS